MVRLLPISLWAATTRIKLPHVYSPVVIEPFTLSGGGLSDLIAPKCTATSFSKKSLTSDLKTEVGNGGLFGTGWEEDGVGKTNKKTQVNAIENSRKRNVFLLTELIKLSPKLRYGVRKRQNLSLNELHIC